MFIGFSVMDTKVFGCKVNKFYINKWLEYFAHRPEFSYGNKAIIATCVVTDRAKAKWVKDVRKRLESGQEIYLT